MSKNSTGLFTVSLKTVRENYLKDNALRVGNKSANAVLLNLIDLVGDDEKTITCEKSKSGAIFNRGSVAECCINLLLKGTKSATKKGAGKCDLIHRGIHYEVKCSTNKGYATYDPRQDYSNLIFVNKYGVFLTNGDNIILDPSHTHIKDIKMNKNTKMLYSF